MVIRAFSGKAFPIRTLLSSFSSSCREIPFSSRMPFIYLKASSIEFVVFRIWKISSIRSGLAMPVN